ncbi:MAG: glycosyltransferase family 39 protein [Ardenticatenia bacterium]|nr:glycosyltransferase family 39 protein [Ardenticatenia bacterium]
MGLNWDGGYLFHPDERFLLAVADQVRTALFAGERGLLEALNPFWDPSAGTSRLFPYGHTIVYLAALAALPATPLAPWVGLDPLVAGVRLLAALADTAAVALTYALGRTVDGRATGLLAGGLVALAVLHVQYAHFYTADTLLAPTVLAALLAAVRLANVRTTTVGWRRPLVAGLLVGLAVGVKASALVLLVPLVVAHLVAGPPWSRRARRTWWRRPAWGWLWLSLLAGGLAFAVTNPYALLAWPDFLRSLAREANMVRGTWILPFTLQYADTRPYLYPLLQQVRWFLGPLPATLAWGGVAVALGRAARGTATRSEVIVLAWVVPFVLLVGGLFAMFPRYWLAVIPAMCVLGSRPLAMRFASPWARAGVVAIMGNALLFVVAFVHIYRQPHPWWTGPCRLIARER